MLTPPELPAKGERHRLHNAGLEIVAVDRLSKAGVVLGCQTVLLKGVNDDPKIMMKLMHAVERWVIRDR